MKKLILAFCAVMLLMLCCTALADEVYVYGYHIYDGETWYFDNNGEEIDYFKEWTTKVTAGNPAQITLRNCDIEIFKFVGEQAIELCDPAFVSADVDVELVLEGNNTIRVPKRMEYAEGEYVDNEYNMPVFAVNGDLTVSGSGSLTVNQGVTIWDGYDFPDYAQGSFEYVPFAPVTVAGKLTMNSGNMKVDMRTGGYSVGLMAGKLHMQGGELQVHSSGEIGTGAFIFEETTIDGGSASFVTPCGYGFRQNEGDITVNGGKLYAEGPIMGIYAARGNLNVNGGSVEGFVTENYGYAGIFAVGCMPIVEQMSMEDENGLVGGYINANGMNVYNLDSGNQETGTVLMADGSDGRMSSVFPMGASLEDDNVRPAYHALITEPIPETGDGANLILWVSMIAMACAALIYMKKRYA